MSEERLFFDVCELAPGSGSSIGIYNYAKHLFRALVLTARPGLTVIVVCNRRAVDDFRVANAVVPIDYRVVAHDRPGILRRLAWTYLEAAIRVRLYRASLYFSPRGFLPFGLTGAGGVSRTVATVHDLIPLWYRDHFPRFFGRFHQWFICAGLVRGSRKSDVVVTISDASAADIHARTGTTARVVRIYNGVDAVELNGVSAARDYLLAMTSSLPHKNAACILAAYASYRQRSANPRELVIVGLRGRQAPGVRAVTGLSDASLRNLYAGARCFIFMSLAEGFGFPPIEAMEAGTATICSDIPVLKEVTHGEAIYVDPRRPDALADAMLRIDTTIEGPGDEARRRGVAQSYSWQRCADEFFDVVNSLAANRTGSA